MFTYAGVLFPKLMIQFDLEVTQLFVLTLSFMLPAFVKLK